MTRFPLRLTATVLAVLSLAAAPHAVQDQGTPSTTGLVVSTSGLASDAGAGVLARGGNAVDAAVATAFALAVTHPSAGNIGGGGFMIVRAPDGRTAAFDYRERAPVASTQTMYLDAEGQIDRSLTAAGYVAPGVPGTVRGLALAHKRFGRLPWKAVVSPAVALATDVLDDQGEALAAEPDRCRSPHAAASLHWPRTRTTSTPSSRPERCAQAPVSRQFRQTS